MLHYESHYYFQLSSLGLFITPYTKENLIMWKEDQRLKNLNVDTTTKMPHRSTSENITSESSSDT